MFNSLTKPFVSVMTNNTNRKECYKMQTIVIIPIFNINDRHLGPWSQHFIFFVTYKSAQLAIVLCNTSLERLASDKHSNLLVQCESYEEKEVL